MKPIYKVVGNIEGLLIGDIVEEYKVDLDNLVFIVRKIGTDIKGYIPFSNMYNNIYLSVISEFIYKKYKILKDLNIPIREEKLTKGKILNYDDFEIYGIDVNYLLKNDLIEEIEN